MTIIFLLLLHLAALSVYGAESSNGSEFRPGLLAEYRSLTKNPAVPPVRRIDAKPSFSLGDMNPHPRLPPGPFSVTWTGRIDLDGDEQIRFGAFLSGELLVLVDGEAVLRTRNREKDAWQESRNPLSRAAGTFPIKIVFNSVEGSAPNCSFGGQADRFPRNRFQRIASCIRQRNSQRNGGSTRRGNGDE